MGDRYFVETPIQGGDAVLTGPEAHHLIHVMRAGPGLEVVLFDGSGAEFTGRVEKVGRTEASIAILTREEVDRELPFDLTLGVSLPKGDRQKWLVEKAVELGVRRIVPLRTVRSVAQPVEQALTRLRRTVIEASKQCGRNRLMAVDKPRPWGEFAACPTDAARRWLAHPGGVPVHGSVPNSATKPARIGMSPSAGDRPSELHRQADCPRRRSRQSSRPLVRKAASAPRKWRWPLLPVGSRSTWGPVSFASKRRPFGSAPWWHTPSAAGCGRHKVE